MRPDAPDNEELFTRLESMYGQGRVLVSPLAMALVAATADTGTVQAPRLVTSVVDGPGAAITGEHDDGTFDSSVRVKFGPLGITFNARVGLELDAVKRQGQLTAQGRDSQGGTRFRAAMGFSAAIQVASGEREADAKSLLSVLALGAKSGTELRLSASGDDAGAALEALRERVATLS